MGAIVINDPIDCAILVQYGLSRSEVEGGHRADFVNATTYLLQAQSYPTFTWY